MDSAPQSESDSLPTLSPSAVWLRAYQRYIAFWVNLAKTAKVSEDDAKDIVHNVLSSIFLNNSKEFESFEHIRNYVAKAILNRAIQVRQRNDKRSVWGYGLELKFPVDPGLDEMDEKRERELFIDALQRLPRIDFEIIKLRFYAGLTFSQINCLLQVPISTLKSREEAALKKLRRFLCRNGYKDTP